MTGRPKRRAWANALRYALEHGPEAARREFPDDFSEADYERLKDEAAHQEGTRARMRAHSNDPDDPFKDLLDLKPPGA